MNLVDHPENPVPPGAILSAARARDGILLRVVRWPARPNRNGTVLLLPGCGTSIESSLETAGDLLRRGFDVVSFDWRGQGGSDRELPDARASHIDDFAIYARDLRAIVDQVVRPFCPSPLFGLAQGMGGTVLAGIAHDDPELFERIVLLAPMLRLRALGAGLALSAAALDLCGLGTLRIPPALDPLQTRRPASRQVGADDGRRAERVAESLAAAPQLAAGAPTLGWLHAATRAMRPLREPDFPRRTHVPALVLVGGQDRVVDRRAVEQFAHRLKAGHFVTLPGAGHEILLAGDAIRSAFWAAFDAFVPGERLS